MSGIPCAPSIDTGIMFSIHRGHSFFNHPPASLPHATKITAMATGPWTCVIKLWLWLLVKIGGVYYWIIGQSITSIKTSILYELNRNEIYMETFFESSR